MPAEGCRNWLPWANKQKMNTGTQFLLVCGKG